MGMGFEELEVYQEARKLRRRIYKLAQLLPDEEKYNLASQMRRAALSLTNNIAEGHGSRSWKHNISYLLRSRGSLDELLDDINTCQDEEYFKIEHLQDIKANIELVRKLISGYIRHLRKRLAAPPQESPPINPLTH